MTNIQEVTKSDNNLEPITNGMVPLMKHKSKSNIGGNFHYNGTEVDQPVFVTQEEIPQISVADSEHDYKICSKSFHRNKNLIDHRRRHSDKIHKCNLCNKAFRQKCHLRDHYNTHSNIRPYKCEICTRGFNQVSNLIWHKRKFHQMTNKAQFICPICKKVFGRKVSLSKHEQYDHGKPYENNTTICIAPIPIVTKIPRPKIRGYNICNLCDKTLSSRSNLNSHLYIHTNTFRYRCDVCGKGVNHTTNLKRHKLKYHQNTEELSREISLHNHEQFEHGEPHQKNVSIGNASIVANNDDVVIPPIKTTAMLHATETNQVPFAFLQPFARTADVVKVLEAGENQMLVSAAADDFKEDGLLTQNTGNENDAEVQERIADVVNMIQSLSDDNNYVNLLSPEQGGDDRYFETIPLQDGIDNIDDFSFETTALNIDSLALNLIEDEILKLDQAMSQECSFLNL